MKLESYTGRKEWGNMPLNKNVLTSGNINVLHIQKLIQQGWDWQTESK